MSNPSVCAIMLANGRPAMVERALKSFYAQTYPGAWLLVYDTSPEPLKIEPPSGSTVIYVGAGPGLPSTIGRLRNEANNMGDAADILIHWDSDDWSHANRIAEQVELLQSSGKQCVGYRNMLFWRDAQAIRMAEEHDQWTGEAWLYTETAASYCLGTSLCYWRKTWEARPFPDLPKVRGGKGEDTEWLRGVDALGVSMLGGALANAPMANERTKDRPLGPNLGYGIAPRMIASIHGGNTSTQYEHIAQSHNWLRAQLWDSYCRERMMP